MAEHARCRAGVRAVVEVHVGVAHPRRRRAHEHLARPGLVDLHLLDIHRRVDFTEYGCLHDSSSLGGAMGRPMAGVCHYRGGFVTAVTSGQPPKADNGFVVSDRTGAMHRGYGFTCVAPVVASTCVLPVTGGVRPDLRQSILAAVSCDVHYYHLVQQRYYMVPEAGGYTCHAVACPPVR